MPLLPVLQEPAQTKIHTETFAQRNHKLKIAANDWYETKNISTDGYPMLTARQKRGAVRKLTSPSGCIAKDAMIVIDGEDVIINESVTDLKVDPALTPKQLVSMGAYLVIFPDKKFINTANHNEFGDLEKKWEAREDTSVSYSICTISGDEYENLSIQASEPETHDGYWLDTSGDTHTLNQWNEASGMWMQIPTVYTKIEAAGIGDGFADYDGVTISGIAYSESGPTAKQFEAINGNKVIYKCSEDYIVVVGLLSVSNYVQTGGVTIERKVPEMDYVCEAGNRIWGCKYGMVDGKAVNEIYGCKLGDFKNWNCFLGISTDSWAASVGSDGLWTAAVNYLGYPTFFKEDRIHQVLISSAGAHQIQESVCSGVEKGAWRSPSVAGQVLFYKGRNAIYAFDGAQPVEVSDALGDVQYHNARAGSVRGKYYISMQDESGQWHLFAYDTSKGFWMREDNTRAMMFATKDDDLYFIDEDTNELKTVYGTEGELEADVEWEAESGVQGYEYAEKKYIGRYNFRVKLDKDSSLTLWIEYDSSGNWLNKGTIHGDRLATHTIPVIPQRCDHLRYKLTGNGSFQLFSITRTLERGSDM